MPRENDSGVRCTICNAKTHVAASCPNRNKNRGTNYIGFKWSDKIEPKIEKCGCGHCLEECRCRYL